MDRIVGLDRTTAQVHDHLHDTGNLQNYHKASNVGFDPTTNPLFSDNVQYALSEFANKPMASPVHETSSGVVSTTTYQIQATANAYVGVPGEDPNATFAVYDTQGIELPITIVDVTSDAGGTSSVVGNIWHNKPYLQLSAAPNQQIMIKYGTQTTLGELPINAFLKEGVIAAEVDSDVVNAIAEIKGTAWDVTVPSDRNLVGLDNRLTTIEAVAHVHRYNIIPSGAMDGVNSIFNLPGSEEFVLGTLCVYLSGIRLPSTAIGLMGPPHNSFQILVEQEQLPVSAMNDTLEIDYILEDAP
jgi:hypothetical protein